MVTGLNAFVCGVEPLHYADVLNTSKRILTLTFSHLPNTLIEKPLKKVETAYPI